MTTTLARTWNGIAEQVKTWRHKVPCPQVQAEAEAPPRLDRQACGSEELEQQLWKHLSDFANVQSGLRLHTPGERLRQIRKVTEDARSLAFEISLIPNYRDSFPLVRAQETLVDYWRSSWATRGISECEYRTSLKAAILFLRQGMTNTGFAEPLDLSCSEFCAHTGGTLKRWGNDV